MFLRAKGGAAASGDFSFIGPEMTISGNVETSGRLHVDGRVTGDVRCGSLVQGEKGVVTGNIFAGDARLGGLVEGGVEAGSLTLEASARITGDVLYESLGIAPGAEVEGRFRRRKGPAPDASADKPEARRPARARANAPDLTELFPAPPAAEAAE